MTHPKDHGAPVQVHFEDNTKRDVRTIYCIGRNYEDHAKELGNAVPRGEPVVFLKSQTSLRALAQVPIAFATDTFHHEVELVLYLGSAVGLGKTADWSCVEAITLGLDLTRRETQNHLKSKGLPWTTAKSFAGSAIVAPFLSKNSWEGKTQFQFQLKVDGDLRQSGDTKDMLFDVPAILTYLASLQPLQAGDIVFTGTPAGVAPLKQGQAFELQLAQPQRIWQGVL